MLKQLMKVFTIGSIVLLLSAFLGASVDPESVRRHPRLYGRVLSMALVTFSLAFSCVVPYTARIGFYYLGGRHLITRERNPIVFRVGLGFLVLFCTIMLISSVVVFIHLPDSMEKRSKETGERRGDYTTTVSVAI